MVVFYTVMVYLCMLTLNCMYIVLLFVCLCCLSALHIVCFYCHFTNKRVKRRFDAIGSATSVKTYSVRKTHQGLAFEVTPNKQDNCMARRLIVSALIISKALSYGAC